MGQLLRWCSTAALCLLLLASCACGRAGKSAEIAYVAAPQVNMRDRVAALYNRTGTLKNGERVVVLERSRRFVRVKNAAGETGWVEERNLVDADVYRELTQLSQVNRNTPVQASAVARASLRIHLTPGRDTPSLFQLADGEKAYILKHASIEKAGPAAAAGAHPATLKEDVDKPAPAMEDWSFIRDADGHVGWVLARMLDVDLPLGVAQYSEGQRIVAFFELNKVHDDDAPDPNTLDDTAQRGPRDVPQYLVLYTEPKDGLPWDFDQVRVFTWNAKRHHYETAYRERRLFGLFPARVTTEDFGKDGGVLPVFSLRVRNDDGTERVKKYRLIGPVVRRVMTPAEEAAERAQRANRKSPAKRRR